MSNPSMVNDGMSAAASTITLREMLGNDKIADEIERRNAVCAAQLAVERAARAVSDAVGVAPIDAPALEAITALRDALTALDVARDGRTP